MSLSLSLSLSLRHRIRMRLRLSESASASANTSASASASSSASARPRVRLKSRFILSFDNMHCCCRRENYWTDFKSGSDGLLCVWLQVKNLSRCKLLWWLLLLLLLPIVTLMLCLNNYSFLSCDHKRDIMNEKGGRVIINAKSFIVIMSVIMILKIKIKHEKGITKRWLTLSQDIILKKSPSLFSRGNTIYGKWKNITWLCLELSQSIAKDP